MYNQKLEPLPLPYSGRYILTQYTVTENMAFIISHLLNTRRKKYLMEYLKYVKMRTLT